MRSTSSGGDWEVIDLPEGFTHLRAPLHWHEGFPLGNGALGAMLWGDGGPLCFTLDHADLWDLRVNTEFLDDPQYNYAGMRAMLAQERWEEAREVFEDRQRRDALTPTKLHIGRAELSIGSAQRYECGLDLAEAMVRGRLWVGDEVRKLEAFVHKERSVLCVRVAGAEGFAVRPLVETAPELRALAHPEAEWYEGDRVSVMTQAIPEGPVYAVAWATRGDVHFLAVELGETGWAARSKAVSTLASAMAAGYDRLRAEHVEAWRRFWAVSAVHLPEPRMEFLWRYGLYLLAGSARRGHLPPGLQGVWGPDGQAAPWHGDYHTDMNVQETFWPAGPCGHIDLLDCWCDAMLEMLPAVQEFTRRFFGTEGTFYQCSMMPHYALAGGWYTCQFAWSSTGWLAWLVWLRWRYTLDVEWLRGTGYPLVAECFRFYAANVEEGEDGRLHVPLSTSPEFRENHPAAWASDPTIDLALIRKTCDWIMEMEAALGIEELAAEARRVHEALAPYPIVPADRLLASGFVGEKILGLWPGQPLPESHRHPSHLMPIHPAMDLTIEGTDEERQIIADSLAHFLELGQYRWGGHTYAQWVSFAACVGRGGMAYDALRQFADKWIGPNGMHFNRDWGYSGSTYFSGDLLNAPFTMEASNGVAAGICDMLLQGWNDRLRIFPAVPGHWREAAFRDLVAEGAWVVSAVRLEGQTVWVKVRATVARELRLKDCFEGREVSVTGAALRREGEDWLGRLEAGREVVLAVEGAFPGFEEAVAAMRRDVSSIGLR